MSYDYKVIGYVSIGADKMSVLCDEDACIVMGSIDAMHRCYKQKNLPEKDQDFRKARFGHIYAALKVGAAYAFDEDALKRYLSILDELKIPHKTPPPIKEEDKKGVFPLYRMQWFSSESEASDYCNCPD